MTKYGQGKTTFTYRYNGYVPIKFFFKQYAYASYVPFKWPRYCRYGVKHESIAIDKKVPQD